MMTFDSFPPAVASVGSLGASRRPCGDAPRQTPRQVRPPPPKNILAATLSLVAKKRTNHLTKRERPVDFPGQHGRLCARPCPDVLFYCHATGEPWNTLRFALTSCLRRNLGNFAVTKQRVKRRRAVLARPSFACLVTGIRGPGRKPQRRTRFYGPEHRTESGEQTEER